MTKSSENVAKKISENEERHGGKRNNQQRKRNEKRKAAKKRGAIEEAKRNIHQPSGAKRRL